MTLFKLFLIFHRLNTKMFEEISYVDGGDLGLTPDPLQGSGQVPFGDLDLGSLDLNSMEFDLDDFQAMICEDISPDSAPESAPPPMELSESSATDASLSRMRRRQAEDATPYDALTLHGYESAQISNVRRYSRTRYQRYIEGREPDAPVVDRVIYGFVSASPFVVRWNMHNEYVIGTLTHFRPRGASHYRLRVTFTQHPTLPEADSAWVRTTSHLNQKTCTTLHDDDAVQHVRDTIVEGTYGGIWEY